MKPAALAPLRLRRTRLLLLSSSYEDAIGNKLEGGRGDKPSSRALLRNEELWPYGSYDDFEAALDSLRTWSARVWLPAFYEIHVRNGLRVIYGPKDSPREGQPVAYEGVPEVKRTRQYDAEHRLVVDRWGKPKLKETVTRKQTPIPVLDGLKAQQCLMVLERALADSPLFVPRVISELAGYGVGDAKEFHRWVDKAAA